MHKNLAIISRLKNLSTTIFDIRLQLPFKCFLCNDNCFKYFYNKPLRKLDSTIHTETYSALSVNLKKNLINKDRLDTDDVAFRKQSILCYNCYNSLQIINNSCTKCAKPLIYSFPNITTAEFASNFISTNNAICNDCLKNPPAFDKVYTAFHYQEPLKLLIHTFKYHKGLYLTSLLTNLMLNCNIDKENLGMIVPVPLSKKRMQQRGFNQAAILAKNLAKKFGAPYSDKYLYKIIDTPNQASISGAQRRQNLNNAFCCTKSNHEIITLVDDILTTGSTANAITKTLKASGVKTVNVWCCARS